MLGDCMPPFHWAAMGRNDRPSWFSIRDVSLLRSLSKPPSRFWRGVPAGGVRLDAELRLQRVHAVDVGLGRVEAGAHGVYLQVGGAELCPALLCPGPVVGRAGVDADAAFDADVFGLAAGVADVA